MSRMSQRGGIFGKLLLVALILGLIGVAALGGIAYQGQQQAHAPGPLTKPALLIIDRGNGVVTVAEKLEYIGAINDARLFRIVARIDELAPALQAGEYEIPAGASIRDIVRLLKEGKPVLRFVTIPEGLTTRQIIARLSDVELLTGEITLTPGEGDLLPETYSYQRGASRDSIIQRMMVAHDEVVEELWPGRADGLPFTTPEQAVILASIVEKETGLADERPLVASVFVNRLLRKPPMRLQSDPTIIYGITGGEPLGRGIRRSELNRVTPYNTYRIDGLPPTPIANPGRAAIAAVLNPPQTDYLFFVADGTGGHAFAKTNAEHARNVAQWRQIERGAVSSGQPAP